MLQMLQGHLCGELGYLQSLVVSLQLSAESLQFAASQYGPAVLALQLVLLLHHLEELLLQNLHLFLITTMLLQLQEHGKSETIRASISPLSLLCQFSEKH